MKMINEANLSNKVTHMTGRPAQVWGTCKVQNFVPGGVGTIEETKILCCNGDGTGWIYDIAEEAEGRDDLSFHEAIDKDTEEPVMVASDLDECASDLICD